VPPNRSQALAGAFLATAFLAGGATGWGLRGWAVAKRRPGERDPKEMVAHLTKQLGLSRGKQDSVRTVLERHRIDVASIWHVTRPRMDSLRRVMQVEIEDQLTPVQRSRFNELLGRRERQRRAADSLGEEEWDSDHDRIPLWLDKCRDTPRGMPVDTTGCAAHSDDDDAR
jgi:hypothetical protein